MHVTDDAIAVRDARTSEVDRVWLQNVYPMYLHEVTRFSRRAYKLNEKGKWEPDYLPYWLRHDYCHALVISRKGERAGFAFVGEKPFPFMNAATDFKLVEFFVTNPHRSVSFTRAAAERVLHRFSGNGEIDILAKNARALTFWRGVLTDTTRRLVEQSDGPVVRFSFSLEQRAHG